MMMMMMIWQEQKHIIDGYECGHNVSFCFWNVMTLKQCQFDISKTKFNTMTTVTNINNNVSTMSLTCVMSFLFWLLQTRHQMKCYQTANRRPEKIFPRQSLVVFFILGSMERCDLGYLAAAATTTHLQQWTLLYPSIDPSMATMLVKLLFKAPIKMKWQHTVPQYLSF